MPKAKANPEGISFVPELRSARRSNWYRARKYFMQAARTFTGVVEEVWDISKKKKRNQGKTRSKKGGPLLSDEWDYMQQTLTPE